MLLGTSLESLDTSGRPAVYEFIAQIDPKNAQGLSARAR